MTLRFATDSDVSAIATLHAARISEGFLVTLGPGFLRRLYRRMLRSPGAFVLVVDEAGERAPKRVCGFIAVAGDTRALYREFILPAGIAATPGIVRAPGAVWETFRYGMRGREHAAGAEVLSTAVAADCGGRGFATSLVRAAVEELRRRGTASARVVTAVGNLAAVKAYEGGGFHAVGLEEVHRGVAQQLLVWP
jgi:ribosomal protein S18 acetylase RimI-like enzyme